jgi:RND family efflux transporter MFP subunit
MIATVNENEGAIVMWVSKYLGLIVVGMAFVGAISSSASAEDIDGFTEPFRVIDLASPEIGVLQEIEVHEGETVLKGSPVARLNSSVQQARLAVAKQAMDATGALDQARAEMDLRERRLEKLLDLETRGHAHAQEIDRARTDVIIAEAQVRTAVEEQQLKRLDYDRIMAQFERLTIYSPIDGVVTELVKEEGEFVAPNSASIATIVQLNPLLANFNIGSDNMAKYKTGGQVTMELNGQTVKGTVHFVSPITDAQSGTVKLKVKIDNSGSKYRSGESITLK